MISRDLFQLFSGGFALSLILKNIILTFAETKRNYTNVFMNSCFAIYLSIQLSHAWSDLTGDSSWNSLQAMNFLTFSTILYTISLLSTMYISAIRMIILSPSSSVLKKIVKYSYIPLILAFCLVRTVRTSFQFVNNKTPTFSTKTIAILQISTLLPVIVIRIFLDLVSIKAVWDFQRL